ncbi:ATP-dependent DNA helicase PIF1-like [Pipra filicauda]|uniref:ATP-dependent DNA helicase n=1 Tax=Pipra filicauda TaxID=649802 RepID=A0A7R5KMQ0_9PASS|nr:ATP-dependent DNA helicase PIF1-like [Pipra filicauda]
MDEMWPFAIEKKQNCCVGRGGQRRTAALRPPRSPPPTPGPPRRRCSPVPHAAQSAFAIRNRPVCRWGAPRGALQGPWGRDPGGAARPRGGAGDGVPGAGPGTATDPREGPLRHGPRPSSWPPEHLPPPRGLQAPPIRARGSVWPANPGPPFSAPSNHSPPFQSGSGPASSARSAAARPLRAAPSPRSPQVLLGPRKGGGSSAVTFRAVRKRDEPFGGIQLIICGDFLQLPPVCKANEETKFCFQAKSWRKCIHINMELTEVRRQTDKTFVSLLSAIRLGRCTEEVTRQLMQTATNRSERDGILATRLCTHKDDVEITNERRLQQLSGEVHTFEALDSDPMLVKLIDAQCPVGGRVELKLGAQVMLAKNLDVSQGLVNGARGVVVGFESEQKGLPKVRFLCGVTQVIRMEKWVFKGPSGVHLSRQQLPLKLAWAISIHKSQKASYTLMNTGLGNLPYTKNGTFDRLTDYKDVGWNFLAKLLTRI